MVLLGLGGLREGSAFARAGCTRISDLWNPVDKNWKSLAELGMSYHASNRKCKEVIIASIPWRPDESVSHPQAGDWINDPTPTSGTLLDWVYFVFESAPGQASVVEFKKNCAQWAHSSHHPLSTHHFNNKLPPGQSTISGETWGDPQNGQGIEGSKQ
jgi:hypothetical protein